MRQSIFILLLALCVVPAVAAIHDVTPGMSIQMAVNNAVDGDTVLIYDGEYQETTVLYGKTITIASLYLMDGDTSHVAATIIYAANVRPDTGSCFVYAHSEGAESRLVGLKLIGNTGTHLVNTDYMCGGAVFIHGSKLSVERCWIYQSSATLGGGIAAKELNQLDSTSCSLRECTIEGCSASGWGGGVYAWYCILRINHTTFSSNTAVTDGGGLYAMARHSIIDSCSFIGNFGAEGGAMFGNGINELTNSTFVGNGCYFGSLATDLFVVDCDALIRGCLFDGEGASSDPGIHLVEYAPENRIDFVGNVVRDHLATSFCGAIIMAAYSNGDFAYNVILGNTGYQGALCPYGAAVIWRIHHNAFLYNTPYIPEHGSAMNIPIATEVYADSNIFMGNNGNAVTEWQMAGQHGVGHFENNWWGHPSGPYHPTLNPTGQGDTLRQDSIYFIPWLTEPPDTSYPQSIGQNPVVAPSTWELLDVYPNPFNNSLHVVLAGFAGQDFELSLHNLLGQQVDIVHSGQILGGRIHYTPPASLSSGIYFLRATDRTRVLSTKVMFMK